MVRFKAVLGCLLLFATLAMTPTTIDACNGVPYPILEIFLETSDGDYPTPAIQNYTGAANASCNAGVANPVPTTRLYFIDEDTSYTFRALWNTLGNFQIQVSDSQITNLTDQININAEWWDGPALLPMDKMSLLAGSQSAIPAFNPLENMHEDPQGIAYFQESDKPADPMKQMCFCVSPMSGYLSNNSEWNTANDANGIISSAPSGYPVQPGTKLNDVFEGGQANCPLPTCFASQMTCLSNVFDGADVNQDVLKWMPCVGQIYGETGDQETDGATRTKVTSGYWDISKDPKWTFSTMGVQWNWDSTDLVKTEVPGAMSDLTGALECSFPVPCEPFFIECRVTCLMLFCLRNAEYVWYEVDQTRNAGAFEPIDAFDTDGNLRAEARECRYKVYGYFLRGSETGASQSTTLICVRDKTPPDKIVYRTAPNTYSATPPRLFGRTGDLLVEAKDSFCQQDNYANGCIEVSMVDNNPFAGFAHLYKTKTGNQADLSLLKQADPGYTGETYGWALNNLFCKVFYTTELYDYCKASNSAGDFTLAHNFYKPKMVWAQGATPTLGSGVFSLDSLSQGGDVADALEDFPETPVTVFSPETLTEDGAFDTVIYDENGADITASFLARLNGSGDIQRLTAGGTEEPAYSVTTFKIPIAAFKEPLPLHLSRNTSSQTPGTLFWYPVVSDGGGNAAPYDDDDDGSLPYAKSGSGTQFDLDGTTAVQPPDETGELEELIKASSMSDFTEAQDGLMTQAKGTLETFDLGSQLNDPEMTKVNTLNVTDATLTDGGACGKMGVIEVSDDEPPQVFIYVTDTKYTAPDTNKPLTYRFGIQRHGDAVRPGLMTDGWCVNEKSGDIDHTSPATSSSFFGDLESDMVGTRYSYDLTKRIDRLDSPSSNLTASIRRNNTYEPTEEVVFGEKFFTDYNDYFTKKDTFDPSAQYPAALPGCWVDEDSRLLFHVVAYDNCFTHYSGTPGSFSEERPASLLQRKETDDFERNGIKSLSWKIVDDGRDMGASATAYQKEYIFRNPNVDDSFNLVSGKDCSVSVTAEDYSGNIRTVRVNFFVQNNKMRFRSLEEKRKGWKAW